MANKPLKSIKYPGLSDTYTFTQVDPTLTQSGQAADAKVVGDLKSAIAYDESVALVPLYGKNLANGSDFVSENLINWATGEPSANASYDASGFVRVVEGVLYGFVGTSVHFAFYDNNKNYYGKVTVSNSLSNLDGYGDSTTATYGETVIWFIAPITGYFRYTVLHGVPSVRRVFMAIHTSTEIINTTFPAYVDGTDVELSNNPTIREIQSNVSGITETLDGVDFHFLATANLFDETHNLKDNYYIDSGNGNQTYNTSFKCVDDFVDISKNTGHIVVLAFKSDMSQFASFHRGAFYDNNKAYISGVSNGVQNGEPSTGVVTVPQNAKYFRCGWRESDNIAHYGIFYASSITNVGWVEYKEVDATPQNLYSMIGYGSYGWAEKTVLTYGDSITAINNPLCPTGSWGAIMKSQIGMNKVYGRGVGGQSYVWNTNTFQVNENGEYVDRGTSADNCLGCFCSWQRITSMIPASIKDDIDLIIVMGGTNDFAQNTPLNSSYDSWKWKDTNTTDAQWANATGYYNGGDFDVSIFQGAVASTIMKMQKWCPNALLVIATPLSGAGNGSGDKTDFYYIYNKTTKAYSDAVKDVSEMFSIPLIDIYGTVGINPFNRGSYIADSYHPYNFDGNNSGNRALARAMISGLKCIEPIIPNA